MKSAFVLMALLLVAVVAADPATIWTTSGDCNDPNPQDQNHYAIGDWVYVRGSNFPACVNIGATKVEKEPEPCGVLTITGQPGQASCDPDVVVAGPVIVTIEQDGSFCYKAYQVQPDDCGEYKVDVDGKHDNYRVDEEEPNDKVPEMSVIGAGIVLAAAGFFIAKRRQ